MPRLEEKLTDLGYECVSYEYMSKLGQIEDILEEYDIKDLAELKIALDYYDHRYDGVSTKRVDKNE